MPSPDPSPTPFLARPPLREGDRLILAHEGDTYSAIVVGIRGEDVDPAAPVRGIRFVVEARSDGPPLA